MTTPDTTTLLAQLRAILDLTHTEIQVAETRVLQARTDAVQRELSENAGNARDRAEAIQSALRHLGGYPDVIGPFFGRAAAAVKALTEQAQPFDEALLGDLALEHQLLDRARYVKALAVAAQEPSIEDLASRLITAHSATVDWLTTVLAEDALGGPAALRRTPMQAVAGAAVRLFYLPVSWSARGLDKALETVRSAPPALEELLSRGADQASEALRSVRATTGAVNADETAIPGFDELNVSQAVAAVKELGSPNDIRTIIAYEEAHKDRQGVVSAAQTRLADIAKDVVGIS